ncbi:hypothetical protein [Pseudonocardia adelaidensis]|uniref:Uncharacterized protein n=1 Tax=Pseudonocardia adelaidensis TaxID=648754 RepID=A0ABP9NK60_9PSEU
MDGEAQFAERELIARERGVMVPVSSRLTASWRRSAGYGVSLDAVNPVFAGQVDDGSLFFECVQEVLHGLHTTLADEPVSLILTDSAG